jgi:hypothetical protein
MIDHGHYLRLRRLAGTSCDATSLATMVIVPVSQYIIAFLPLYCVQVLQHSGRVLEDFAETSGSTAMYQSPCLLSSTMTMGAAAVLYATHRHTKPSINCKLTPFIAVRDLVLERQQQSGGCFNSSAGFSVIVKACCCYCCTLSQSPIHVSHSRLRPVHVNHSMSLVIQAGTTQTLASTDRLASQHARWASQATQSHGDTHVEKAQTHGYGSTPSTLTQAEVYAPLMQHSAALCWELLGASSQLLHRCAGCCAVAAHQHGAIVLLLLLQSRCTGKSDLADLQHTCRHQYPPYCKHRYARAYGRL